MPFSRKKFQNFLLFFAETAVTFSMKQDLSTWKQVVTQYDLISDSDYPLVAAILLFLR